jgi:hypothetical protein
MFWCLLVLSLPTDNATARMRAWRALKAGGAAVLRDGVYLLPEGQAQRALLREVADDVLAHGGSAHVFGGVASDEPLDALFDRASDFAALLAEARTVKAAATRARSLAGAAARPRPAGNVEAVRAARRLRKSLDQLVAIDFFPGEAQRQASETVAELEQHVARLDAHDEPRATPAGVPVVERSAYHGRTWVTRARPWVDRLACAWLIRRFIDPQARFLWLADPSKAPKRAVGYDFDGATFTHVGARVSFETLLAAFGLETPALKRLGTLVHGLDAGGVMPPEAAGIERVLAGMRDAIADDDTLMLAAAGVFEGLHQTFEKEAAA